MPAKFPFTSYVAQNVSGALTEAQVAQMITDMTASLVVNGATLSDGERAAVVQEVEDEIAASGAVTESQVETMIETALAAQATSLTPEQVQAIIDDAVASAVATMPMIPDYSKFTVLEQSSSSVLMPDAFVPWGTFNLPTGFTATPGKTITIPVDSYIAIYGWMRFDDVTSVIGEAYLTFIINGRIANRVIGVYAIPIHTGYGEVINLQSDPIPVKAGDQVYVTFDVKISAAGSFFVGNSSRLYYYPMRPGSASVTQTDLNTFATTQMLMQTVEPVSDGLDAHRTTDRFRWQDTYDEQRDSIVRDAANAGLMPDDAHTVSVPAPTDPMTVSDEAGGVLGIEMRNTDTAFCTVTINGVEMYSSDGLASGVPVTKYYWLNQGDTVISTNADEFTYTPFITNPASQTQSMLASIQALNGQVASLRNDILDIKASIANLQPDIANTVVVVDKANAIDITSGGTYTVNNVLGGRLTGDGYTLLGLLGLKLVATGTVDVNDTRVYDNTALVGSDVPPLVIDVNNGDVIATSGMNSLTFTPYVTA